MTKKTWTDAAKRGRKIMGSFRMLALLAAMFFLAGCTSVIVSPLPYDANLKEIKLLNNPAFTPDEGEAERLRELIDNRSEEQQNVIESLTNGEL